MESTVSTYYAYRARPPARRAIEDERLAEQFRRVHEDNYSVYGIRKVWHAFRREGLDVGRDRVARLMAAQGLHGVRRGKRLRTTIPAEAASRPPGIAH
jgi:transposase InsO family protein